MSILKPNKSRPLLPLALLHAVAAAICFTFFTVVSIAGCVAVMKLDNDAGGPLFFPIFVMGVVILAGIIAAFLAAAVSLTDLLRRRFHVPLYLPPLAVFLCATGLAFACLLNSDFNPVYSPVVGIAVVVTFFVHWASISAAWALVHKLYFAQNHSSGVNQ